MNKIMQWIINHPLLAVTLYKCGWIPQELNEKVVFYLIVNMDDEIIKIGSPAFPALFKHWSKLSPLRIARIWEKFAKIGAPAIPGLVEALKLIETNVTECLAQFNYRNQYIDEFIFSYNKISDVLYKLNNVNGKYLYEWIPETGQCEIVGHYEPIYGACGDSVMNGQPCGQEWVDYVPAKDYKPGFYAKIERFEYN